MTLKKENGYLSYSSAQKSLRILCIVRTVQTLDSAHRSTQPPRFSIPSSPKVQPSISNPVTLMQCFLAQVTLPCIFCGLHCPTRTYVEFGQA
ncbi:hypothetical protein ABKN59_001255 [Abortiporus biennis]